MCNYVVCGIKFMGYIHPFASSELKHTGKANHDQFIIGLNPQSGPKWLEHISESDLSFMYYMPKETCKYSTV